MALPTASVKNLLIDLGGVLYKINVQKTFQSYHDLLPTSLKGLSLSKLAEHPSFKKLDRGLIEIDEFAQSLIEDWQLQVEPEEVKQIWINLLLGLYPRRVSLVQALSEKYKIALLSNTCRYHYEHYISECKPMFDTMDELFFSFEMGVTKPEAAIYQTALERMGWQAKETLFMDDSAANVAGAKHIGIQAALIAQAQDFEDLAAELLK